MVLLLPKVEYFRYLVHLPLLAAVVATADFLGVSDAAQEEAENVEEEETEASLAPAVTSRVVSAVRPAAFGTMNLLLFHTLSDF